MTSRTATSLNSGENFPRLLGTIHSDLFTPFYWGPLSGMNKAPHFRQLRVDPLTQVLDVNARQNTPPPIDKPTGTPPIMGPTPPTQQPYSTKTKGSGAANAGK